MKKQIVVLAAIGMVMTFSGCHLRHDMLPATCTEPSTCSVCGKTEGEPLGHTEVPDEAVEATCTESGRTAGTHCEVCGEVLVAQETIAAFGHDWEEATFSEPKTCRVCGATEGEPLGTELFIHALNEPHFVEADSESEETGSARSSGEENDAEDENVFHKEIRIDGHSHGLAVVDDFLNSSSLTVIADIEQEQAGIRAEVVVNGSKPLDILFVGDEEGFGLTLPGIMEEYYYISYETLAELMEESGYGQVHTLGAEPKELLQADELRELFVKYERILFSVASLHNTKESRTEYFLPELEKTQKCWVLEISPDKNDWRKMLRKLFSTAAEDEELMTNLIIPIMEYGYSSDPEAAVQYDSAEEYASDEGKALQEVFRSALDEVDSLAEELSELSFTVAYNKGRVYALSVHDEEEQGLYYESYGTMETEREDVLVMHSEDGEKRLAYNTVSISGDQTKGRFEFLDDAGAVLNYVVGSDENGELFFDVRLHASAFSVNVTKENEEGTARVAARYESEGADAELDITVSDTEERISAPDKKKILKTESEVSEALYTISEAITGAELFGHDWEEASCTEPQTCRICGETEGEPLGHDWGKPDASGTRTCLRCGETETVADHSFRHTEAEGKVWRNDSLGIQYESEKTLYYYDTEEILEENGADEDFLQTTDMDLWLKAYWWTEMCVYLEDGDAFLRMNVTDLMEEVDEDDFLSEEAKRLLDRSAEGNLHSSFEEYGIPDVKIKRTEVSLFGKKVPAVTAEWREDNLERYYLEADFIVGNRWFNVNLFGYDLQKAQSILDGFSYVNADEANASERIRRIIHEIRG